jgi:putative DNA primase/helicase
VTPPQHTTYSTEQLLGWYKEQNWKLVRLSRARKKPVDKEWQGGDLPLEKIIEWVNQGGDVGAQVGEVSDWLGGVDPDCSEAEKLAPLFLPNTLMSRKGNQTPSLYVYRCVGLGFATFKDLDGSTLIDLKASNNGAGHQIVVEPSMHLEKGPYGWIGGFNPAAIAEVSKEELRAAVGMLAAATLIARKLPDKGRHDLALALVGYLLRNGVSPEDTLKIMLDAWRLKGAPREALQDIESIVRDTKTRLDRDEPTTGGRTLEEMISGMPARIAKFLGWEQFDRRELRPHYERSDLGNAERFVDMHGDRARWSPARKMFLFYDGKRWRWDECGEVLKLAQKTARGIYKDAAGEPDQAKQREIAKFAVSSQNEGRINGMLSQAKPHVAVRLEELDADPWLINCQNGTLDLRSGKLKNHSPTDRITKIAPVDYDPSAECPRFKSFLKEVLIEDAVISFVKRYTGYSATGITRERLFAILYGFGKNGKTTLIELLQDVFGDYATNTDTETILMRRYQGVGNDVAALKGARFVSAAEVEKGRQLAESKVKQLTGSDTVTARYLFGEPFDFRPQFKLWLSTNNKPMVRGTDDAIWDRIRLIPFTQRFEGSNADPKLAEKLREELPGVFAWIVEGCLEWQEHGLSEPESVASATKQYREEMDTLAAFLEDKCIVQKGLVAPATPLYKQYRFWCDDAGEKPETQKMFGMRLRERGFTNAKITAGPDKDRKGWFGIGLRADHRSPEDPDEASDDNSRGGSDGPLSDPAADDGPLGETTPFTGETAAAGTKADDSGPKNQNPQGQNPREEEDMEKRSASSASSADDPKDAALLVAGWKPKERGDNSFWIAPGSGFAYSREMALVQLQRGRSEAEEGAVES